MKGMSKLSCIRLLILVVLLAASSGAGDDSAGAADPRSAANITVHLVGHAHIDMNWLWLWPETIEVCKNTFSTAMNLMEEFPGFVFSQSQPAAYLAMQEHHPDVFARIKEAVKRGQWDVTATTWTEGDLNMSGGEAIVRSILYGKRYIKQQFGVESVVCWEPDTFGHPWTMPQILAKTGIKYYYHMRCPGPSPLYWWQSPDGSRVLAYSFGGYSSDISEDGLVHDALAFAKASGVTDYMRVYGVGDHGGGPTREMLNTATALQRREDYPKLKFSSVRDYFDKVAANADRLPVHNGELNTVFEGCYTTHSDIKRWNRECESLIPCAESFAAITLGWGAQYPAEQFEQCWRNTCFNQFHDLLCGSAIHGSYEMCAKLYEDTMSRAESALDRSLDLITPRITTNGPGVPIVVYNPLSWTRTDVVEVPSPFAGEDLCIRISDENGRVFAGQNVGDKLLFTARDVPSLGYKVFWARRTTEPVPTSVRAAGTTIENRFFRVTVDPASGVIKRLYDKLNKRDVFAVGSNAGVLQVLYEEPHGMSAWTIGKIARTEDLLTAAEVSTASDGPVEASVTVKHDFRNSKFAQQIVLHDDVPRIDIRLTADWQQIGSDKELSPMLKAAFPVGLSDARAVFEIPFGYIERPANGAEVPAQKWIDLSGSRYGVGLLNDCKYGFDVKDNVARISLLRSSYDPDPTPDRGTHRMTYSLYPHKGDWRCANTVRRGYELNQPLIGRVTGKHTGTLPKSKSFVWVSEPNLIVTAFKKAEDDDSLVLRFYETLGRACRAKIALGVKARYAVETDLMERPTGRTISLKNGGFAVDVAAYEIKTFKLVPE